MKRPIFQGTCTAMATPLTAESIDTKALTKLVDWQIKIDIKALVACGTTGEPSTMTEADWTLTAQTVIKAAQIEAAGLMQ